MTHLRRRGALARAGHGGCREETERGSRAWVPLTRGGGAEGKERRRRNPRLALGWPFIGGSEGRGGHGGHVCPCPLLLL